MGGRGSSSSSAKSSNVSISFESEAMRIAEKSVYGRDFDSLGQLVPQWVLDKKLSDSERYAWSVGDGAYVKSETDKALLLGNKTDYGEVTVWVPKSVMLDPAKAREDAVQGAARRIVNGRYTDYLKATAVDAGVKIGNTSSWDILTKKMDKKGVPYMSRDQFAKSDPSKVSTVPKPNGGKKPKGKKVSTSFGIGTLVSVKNGIATVILDNGTTKKILESFLK